MSGSIVPRLIDNKRKHLERNLSAAQRDQLFMKEMKNDAEFRKDLLQIVRESIPQAPFHPNVIYRNLN